MLRNTILDWERNRLTRIVAALVVSTMAATAQDPDVAGIERHGGFSTLSVHTFRPLDAVATALQSRFAIAVGAEDPLFEFQGDMMDISLEVSKIRPGTLVPARWGFEVRFPVNADGSPRDTGDLLRSIVMAANAHSGFAYRLEEDHSAFSFVATRSHDAQGRSIAVTPLLDRLVTIPAGIRRINENAVLMAQELSRQTGLRVSCCQSFVAGYPWGMEQMPFTANRESARAVLRRLGLNVWHVRCDREFCFIEMR